MKKERKDENAKTQLFGAEEVNEDDGNVVDTSVGDEAFAEAVARAPGRALFRGKGSPEEHPPTVMERHDIESRGMAATTNENLKEGSKTAGRNHKMYQEYRHQASPTAGGLGEPNPRTIAAHHLDESVPGAHRVDGPNSYIETAQSPATSPPRRQVSITEQHASARTFLAQAELVVETDDEENNAEMKNLRKDLQSLKDENKATRRKILLGCAIVFIVVTIGASLGFYFGLQDDSSDSSSDSSSDNVSDPSSPTPSPIFATPFPTNEFGLTLSSLINQQTPSVSLEDPNDPASQALYWMTHDDASYSSGLSDERQLQRFALATLWYSTGGESTWNQDEGGWLVPGTHECSWDDTNDRRQDVTCDDNDEVERLLMCCSGLEGKIPGEEMSLLSKLSRLDLHSNRLSGTIPSFMGSFTDMFWMDLYDNTLEGTVPTEIGNLAEMTWWSVADNSDLKGAVPTEIGRLTKLSIIYVHGTDLSGTIPDNLCRDQGGFLERADIECDKIECDCCQDHSGTHCN